jgi:hypothetical protein
MRLRIAVLSASFIVFSAVSAFPQDSSRRNLIALI